MIEGGDLTLDAQGNENAVWVFQMASTLTVGGPGAAFPQSIILAGGAQPKNVFWQVGGVTGVAGAPGLIADIPSLYFLIFRTVHQIAICLGHPAHTPIERRYLLQVVNVGHHLELRERRCALMELDRLEDEISEKSGTTEDLQRAMLAKTVQLLARKLTSTLIQRKAAQTVAFVGGAVGAVINRQLVEDVGITARHAYRRRFLKRAALERA